MVKHTKSRGFTIVELLIVIVIIAILAAITLVAYNGITNRAHASASKTAAETLAKKIEVYNAANGAYPITNTAALMTTDLNSTSDSSISGNSVVIGTPSSSASDNTVQLRTCATATQTPGTTVPTGYVIYIWDTTLKSAGLNPVQAGGVANLTVNTDGTANVANNCAYYYTIK